MQKRLARLEALLVRSSCQCPKVAGTRFALAYTDEQARAHESFFASCPVDHADRAIVIRIRSFLSAEAWQRQYGLAASQTLQAAT